MLFAQASAHSLKHEPIHPVDGERSCEAGSRCAVLPLPASVLSLGAGAIFGLVLGTILVWVGAVAGLVGCLLIGRCAFAHDSIALR